MKKTKIVYYIFPFHLDQLERSIYQLKRASNYSNTKDYLCLDVVFDMSDFNFRWDECKIPKQFFIDKFNYIEKYCDFCKEVNFEINNDMLGSGEQQRRVYAKNNGEYNIILLDPDIHFPVEIFHVIDGVVPKIEKETSTYVLTPQIGKFWDDTWNVLSNEEYLNSPVKFDEIDAFELSQKTDVDNISLIKNYNHKFAGGWFTFYSAELTKYMKMPDSIGIFHHVDLYQQEKFKLLNHFKKCDIPQYIIKNCLVQEDRKYYHNFDFWQKYIHGPPQTPHNPDMVLQNVIRELDKIKHNKGNLDG
jgi:hypothetical protein